jgi:MoxR-like ATPase
MSMNRSDRGNEPPVILPRPLSSAELSNVIAQLGTSLRRVQEEVQKCVVGQQSSVEAILCALLSRGHCLIEGVPGLAKTLLVRTLARVMELDFKRAQFTPDLMPADITGTIIYPARERGRPSEVCICQTADLHANVVG